MPSSPRPAVRLTVPALTLGDRVVVRRATSGGVEEWAGVVVDVDTRLGLAQIVGDRRNTTVAVRGAAYVSVTEPAAMGEHGAFVVPFPARLGAFAHAG